MLSARHWLYAAGFALVTSSLWVPSASAQAAGTTCKDGTKSTASGRGACSGHGGVKATAKKATKAEAKVARTDTKADAKVAKTATKAEAKEAKTETKADTKEAKTETKAAARTTKTMAKAAKSEAKVAAAPASTKVGSGAADDNNAAGAIARCKDGMYSHAKSRQGACGHHGGVAAWL